ncbi:MAG: hypothetical protein Q8941_05415, partial [Bacteroidota bacterium]|nr:hypothetical protein [Bacteroidota bacterium]
PRWSLDVLSKSEATRGGIKVASREQRGSKEEAKRLLRCNWLTGCCYADAGGMTTTCRGMKKTDVAAGKR